MKYVYKTYLYIICLPDSEIIFKKLLTSVYGAIHNKGF